MFFYCIVLYFFVFLLYFIVFFLSHCIVFCFFCIVLYFYLFILLYFIYFYCFVLYLLYCIVEMTCHLGSQQAPLPSLHWSLQNKGKTSRVNLDQTLEFLKHSGAVLAQGRPIRLIAGAKLCVSCDSLGPPGVWRGEGCCLATSSKIACSVAFPETHLCLSWTQECRWSQRTLNIGRITRNYYSINFEMTSLNVVSNSLFFQLKNVFFVFIFL